MKKKSDKEKDLEALKKDFEAAQNIFVAGFEKLTVQQDYELRKTVRGAGGNYKVVKNNLAEKASQGTPAEDLMSHLVGMTSMAYTSKDPVALAKALTAYAKVLFLIQASAQRLVTTLGGVGRNLAVVVDQAVKENKFSQ
jgi:large subunit ribosomal protein L10